jgi:hypothetical protein
MKHATIGYVVASEMQKYSYGVGSTDYSDPRYNQYDIFFGFWTSFWADRTGIDIPLKSNLVFKKDGSLDEDKSTFGLIDLANIAKAISFQEKFLNAGDHTLQTGSNGVQYAGLMMVPYESAAFFETSDYYCPWGKGLSFSKSGESFFTPLNNIGIGIGHWFAWLVRKSDYPYKSKGARYAPSIAHWKQAVIRYGGYKEYGVMILDELVYRGISRKRLKKDGSKDKVHDQPLLP